jgi:hypothetical protein
VFVPSFSCVAEDVASTGHQADLQVFDILLSLGFGTRCPLLLRFMVFWMPTLRGDVSIGNWPWVLVSFWVPHWFLGLLSNSQV